jgi:hypothetical protein
MTHLDFLAFYIFAAVCGVLIGLAACQYMVEQIKHKATLLMDEMEAEAHQLRANLSRLQQKRDSRGRFLPATKGETK